MNKKVGVEVDKEVAKFFDDSSIKHNGSPILAIVMGGNGAGKTTHIHDNFSHGYVIVNAEEIYRNIEIFDDFGKKSQKIVNEIGEAVVDKAITEQRNIVLEMIGHTEGSLDTIIEAMTSLGYEVEITEVKSDIKEAYERHLDAVANDKGYLPTYFSEDYHIAWILKAVNKLSKN